MRTPPTEEDARSSWERFARADAEYYVAARAEPFDALLPGGRGDAERIMAVVGELLRDRALAIDLGVGVGRVAIPMAAQFEALIGVDIAPTMLARLRENCERAGVANITPALADEPWEALGDADLVYSLHVFQHIVELDEIRSHLRRTRAALAPGGVAFLHFDSRRRTIPYALRNALPDAVLPSLWRRGIRRIRRPRSLVLELVGAAGLHVVRELEPDTHEHVVVATR